MLKNRSLVILAVILVALAAISLLQKSRQRQATSRPDTMPVLSADFDAERIQSLVVGYGSQKDALVLESLPDGWVVRSAYGHKANQQRIETLMRSLGELAGEFRSESPDVLADYGFTDSTTVSIIGHGAGGGDPIFELEVGKKPERSVGNFVKRPGSAAVYLTRSNILSNLGLYSGPGLPQAKHFLDLEAHRCEREDVDAITLYDGDSVIELVKEFATIEPDSAAADSIPSEPQIDRTTYEWRMTRPQERIALKTKADQILGAVSMLRAVDIDDPAGDPVAYGLDAPQKRAEVRLQDGTTVTLEVGTERPEAGETPGGSYLRVGGDDSIWIVKDYSLNAIFKPVEELFPEEG
jgi:hypothetical protein